MYVFWCKVAIFLTFVISACNSLTSKTDGSGLVRLAGSNLMNRGRLEVYHDGVWGTVCDDVFDEMDARVACFSLGFGHVGFPLTVGLSETYGPGSGPIWLDELQCLGTETFIGDCVHAGWGSTNCQHTEDVSIECSNGTRQVYSKKLALFRRKFAAETTTTTTTTIAAVTDSTTAASATAATTTANDTKFTSVSATTATFTTVPSTATIEPSNTTFTPMTTTTATTTTTHPYLHGPHLEVSLEGGMEAVDSPMTMSCLRRYSRQFRELLDTELAHINYDVLSSKGSAGNSDVISLCGGANDVVVSQAFVNMLALENNVTLDYGVYVTSNSSATLNVIETCSWQVGSYLSNFSNWRQPIWLVIYQCPRLVFTSSQFDVTEVSWHCPAQQ